MPKIRLLCFAGLLLVSETAFAANVRLQLEGLTGQLQKNVRAQLSTIQSDEVTPDRRFQARVDELGVVTKGYSNCKCCMLRILVDFMILLNTYCFLF